MKEMPSTSSWTHSSGQAARHIPKLSHPEATRVALDEMNQMLILLESLSDADWQLPTVCTLWNVRQMVAHLAGTSAGYTSWSQLKRQFILNPYAKGRDKVDAISMCQVEDRAGSSPDELMEELRELGPRAIKTRHRLPWLLRAARVPLGPPLGIAPLGYLTDLIYTRDMWMHRLDICRAAGLQMELTPEHDGRIVQLVMRDLDRKLRNQGSHNIRVELTGPAGGAFDLGSGRVQPTTIQLDALDFSWLAAGRATPDEIRPDVMVAGPEKEAEWLLANSGVPF